MKSLLSITMLSLLCVNVFAQDLMDSQIYEALYKLKYKDEVGSCFILSVENKNYVISAKHLFDDVTAGSYVEFDIFNKNETISLTRQALFHSHPSVDIVVFEISDFKIEPMKLDLSIDYSVSQECYIMGFPNLVNLIDLNLGFISAEPIHFLKKGIISSLAPMTKNTNLIFLDIISDPGFSGGPVLTLDANNNLRVIGVVSSNYENESKYWATKTGPFTVSSHKSISIGFDIRHVLDILNIKSAE